MELHAVRQLSGGHIHYLFLKDFYNHFQIQNTSNYNSNIETHYIYSTNIKKLRTFVIICTKRSNDGNKIATIMGESRGQFQILVFFILNCIRCIHLH